MSIRDDNHPQRWNVHSFDSISSIFKVGSCGWLFTLCLTSSIFGYESWRSDMKRTTCFVGKKNKEIEKKKLSRCKSFPCTCIILPRYTTTKMSPSTEFRYYQNKNYFSLFGFPDLEIGGTISSRVERESKMIPSSSVLLTWFFFIVHMNP